MNKPITKVSFRIFAPALDSNEISQILGMIPDHTHSGGDYPRNNPKYSRYEYGMWSIDSKLPSEKPFSAHLEYLLTIFAPKQQQILKLSEQNNVDFYCSLYSQSGFQLSPNLLRKIAHLGADLDVTVYPPDNENEDETPLTIIE